MSHEYDILPSLEMLNMNVTPIYLSLDYHPIFGYSKQELIFNIFFSKHVDP